MGIVFDTHLYFYTTWCMELLLENVEFAEARVATVEE